MKKWNNPITDVVEKARNNCPCFQWPSSGRPILKQPFDSSAQDT